MQGLKNAKNGNEMGYRVDTELIYRRGAKFS